MFKNHKIEMVTKILAILKAGLCKTFIRPKNWERNFPEPVFEANHDAVRIKTIRALKKSKS